MAQVAALALLGCVALAVGLIWPWYNYTLSARADEDFPAYLARFVRRDPDTNLYLRVWTYDRPGFGPGHGRAAGGHTLADGWANTREYLACAARDLHGWAVPPGEHVAAGAACQSGAPSSGWALSWIPPGLGLLVLGWRVRKREQFPAAILLAPLGLIAVYVSYWAGGTLYSARYYFEALGAACVLSALGIHALITARRGRLWRGAWIAVFAALTLYSALIYAPARLHSLHGYGDISAARIAHVDALRQQPDRPLLVLLRWESGWRAAAPWMALTSPRLDSDVILARDPGGTLADTLVARYAQREIIVIVPGGVAVPDVRYPLVASGGGSAAGLLGARP